MEKSFPQTPFRNLLMKIGYMGVKPIYPILTIRYPREFREDSFQKNSPNIFYLSNPESKLYKFKHLKRLIQSIVIYSVGDDMRGL